ncbi:MAG: 50S ribosome-binding GTPase, partial [Clostridia bacterium]|nr:50S ribosome-binding GTPase [Clostridia bacterium]
MKRRGGCWLPGLDCSNGRPYSWGGVRLASSIIARRTANFIPGELCARKAGQPARPTDRVLVALVGNPNVGKSTLFNLLTGLRQHTGNWPGKTVAVAWGEYRYRNRVYRLIDLPGIYSLESASCEEEVAREFILRCRPDVTVVVLDPGCLARNLGLVL